MLMNDQHVRKLARLLAARVRRETVSIKNDQDQVQIEMLYNMALSRRANKREMALGLQALLTLERQLEDREAALATYCHTLLNSAAFVYVD